MTSPSSSSSRVVSHDVELRSLCASPKDMGNKENICRMGDDADAYSTCKETPAHMKSKRKKGGGCNLRKSLAWNQAFFTEEGVLDPTELFILAGPSTRSNEVSPLMTHQKSRNRPALDVVQLKNFCKNDVSSESKGSRGSNPPFKSKISIQEEQQGTAASGSVPSARRVMKSVPQPSAAHSQKRVANTNAINPTSKIPRFMPMKSRTSSLPAAPKEACPTTKILNNVTVKGTVNKLVNSGKSLGGRGLTSVMKKQSGTPSLFGYPATNNSRFSVSETEKDITNFGSSLYSSSPHQAHGRLISSIPKGCSTNPQDVYHACKSAPAPTQAKPSALRMPSPSLGFFHQGRLPRSCGSSQPSVPPMKNSMPNQRKAGPLPAYTGQRRPEAPVASKVCAEAADCCSTHSFSVTNSSLSSTPSGTYPSIKENIAMMQVDMISNGMASDQESIKSFSLTDDRQPPSSLGRLEPDMRKVPNGISCKLQNDNNYLVENIKPVENMLKVNVPEDVQDTCLSTKALGESKYASGNLPSNNSRVNLLESSLHVEYPAKHPMIGKVVSKSPAVSGNNNLPFDSDISLPAVTDVPTAPLLTKSLVESDKEQRSCFDFISSSELRSSEQKTDSNFENKISRDIILDVESAGSFIQDSSPMSQNNELHVRVVQLDNIEQVNLTREQELVTNKDEQNESKPDIVLAKHLIAVPFSDEWLAAVEAFGEEILEGKTGAVQNSPTEKTVPEPGPWSPVRKVQEVGPFDCTKYSRNPSNSAS